MTLVRVPPYRFAAESGTNVGENALVKLLSGGFDRYLGDIKDSDDLLRHAYVSQRHPADDGGRDRVDPGQFGPNVFAERTDKGWRPADWSFSSKDSIRQLVSDDAEASLIDRILVTAESLSADIYGEGCLSGMGHAATRLSFIQGGIGCGKTTMLRHLIQLTVPDLQTKKLLSSNLPIVYYDLNYKELEDHEIGLLWNGILKAFKEQVGNKTGLQNLNGWERIAQDSIRDSEGRLRPEIECSPSPEEAIRKIIAQADNPATFLKRAARYLWKSATCPVIFVLDNLDWIPNRSIHIGFAKRMLALLEEIPSALGIITVREYTLGNMEESEREFEAFSHVKRLHMTTPLIGEVVRRRLERAIDKISEEEAQNTFVEVREHVRVTPADCKELLQHILDAFEPEIPLHDRHRSSTTADIEGGMRRLSVFLYSVTNSNVRAALEIVNAALRSWALTHDRFVEQYLKQRKQNDIRLSPFTVDELVRLASIGRWLHYDSKQCGLFHNVFATKNREPDRANGFASLLHTYRVLQCISHCDSFTPKQVIDDLECLAQTPGENSDLLQMLLERGFIESRAGLDLGMHKALFPTKKLRFYLRVFSTSLVYLSMVRNDCYLEYQAQPWDFHDGMMKNCHEALKFIEYVLDQEGVQYSYAKDVNRGDKFRSIAGDWPISWRLLRNVDGFLTSVSNRERIPTKELEEIRKRIAELERSIRSQIAQKRVHGVIGD